VRLAPVAPAPDWFTPLIYNWNAKCRTLILIIFSSFKILVVLVILIHGVVADDHCEVNDFATGTLPSVNDIISRDPLEVVVILPIFVIFV
jgi:hypothetical protein